MFLMTVWKEEETPDKAYFGQGEDKINKNEMTCNSNIVMRFSIEPYELNFHCRSC